VINEEIKTVIGGSFTSETCPNPECPSKRKAEEVDTKEVEEKVIEKQPEGEKENEKKRH
jgi:hypothetical protein